MKQFSLLAALLCLCAAAMACIGESIEPTWASRPDGELILRSFANAPYPHASREKGFKNYPQAPHYTDSTVGIFIPKAYVAGDTVNYVVHFHGHVNHVSEVLKKYRLPEQLAASKLNAILIVPQGPKDASDSGCGKLELDKNGLKNLLDEVTAYLKSQGKIKTDKIGKVALSAHSGGYKVTAAVLDHGGMSDQITDVLLLDASYGSLEWFSAWCAGAKDRRLVSLFTDHLADENKTIMDLLAKATVKYDVLEEKTLTDSSLTARRPMFMHTTLAHNDVPMKMNYFQRLLATSSLSQ
jgi:hypothetical protein